MVLNYILVGCPCSITVSLNKIKEQAYFCDGKISAIASCQKNNLRWENLVAIDSLNRAGYVLFEHHATMIDYLHDGAILLLRPKSFSFFLLYLNLEIRSQRGFDNKRPNLHKNAKPEEFWS